MHDMPHTAQCLESLITETRCMLYVNNTGYMTVTCDITEAIHSRFLATQVHHNETAACHHVIYNWLTER